MERCDAVIVGGGPAGSTCARLLRLAGWRVSVVDRARFPRDKVCGGWITPEVLALLDLDPDEYRATGATFQTITGFRTGLIGGPAIETRYGGPVSYAIRRCEFDEFLLRRAGVRVLDGTPLARLERRENTWVVNDALETPVVIGAGGHFCPVARHLQGARDDAQPVVAKELELALEGEATTVRGEVPELFFCRDLQGYGWCVRKGAYLNVGIGRRDREDFGRHVREFLAFLVDTGRAPQTIDQAWHGHAYHAMGAGLRPLVGPGMLIAGDAAGLAYPESGEGIRPAIESGRLAAETLIRAKGRTTLDDLLPYEASVRARHPRREPTPRLAQPAVAALGRLLLQRSAAFTRRVVLDRWFLRTGGRGLVAPA